jgi:hypothetical protein
MLRGCLICEAKGSEWFSFVMKRVLNKALGILVYAAEAQDIE